MTALMPSYRGFNIVPADLFQEGDRAMINYRRRIIPAEVLEILPNGWARVELADASEQYDARVVTAKNLLEV